MNGPVRYRGAVDLEAMQEMVATSARASTDAGYLHPGDIAHRIYNALRKYDPDELVWLWRDAGGVAAFALLYPRWQSFDLQVRYDVRHLDAELLQWCVESVPGVVRSAGSNPTKIAADLAVGDHARRASLVAAGFHDEGPMFVATRRPVRPLPAGPDPGLRVRSVEGFEEAHLLARVHHESFASSWTAEEYERLMRSPGYDPARELIAEGDDGTFAGFTIVWLDPVTGVGLFEPVGTSDRFRRGGVARALMAAGLQMMDEAGIRTAQVIHELSNPASTALYEAMGFRTRYPIHDWCRTLTGEPCRDEPAA